MKSNQPKEKCECGHQIGMHLGKTYHCLNFFCDCGKYRSRDIPEPKKPRKATTNDVQPVDTKQPDHIHTALLPNTITAWCSCGKSWTKDKGWHYITARDYTTLETTDSDTGSTRPVTCFYHTCLPCDKCGGCIYECKHRTKTTLTTSNPKLQDPDNDPDECMACEHQRNKHWNNKCIVGDCGCNYFEQTDGKPTQTDIGDVLDDWFDSWATLGADNFPRLVLHATRRRFDADGAKADLVRRLRAHYALNNGPKLAEPSDANPSYSPLPEKLESTPPHKSDIEEILVDWGQQCYNHWGTNLNLDKALAAIEDYVATEVKIARIEELEWAEHNADDVNFSIQFRIAELKGETE